jgi:hypothetical protein
MGSGFDDWVYLHFVTITVNYNSSHIELLNEVCLTNLCEESLPNEFWILLRDESSLMLRPTFSRLFYLGIKHPSGAYDQIFITVRQMRGVLMWGALSDERTRLSFPIVPGPRQHSHSRVRIPWRDHVLLSQIRDFPFRRLLRLAGLRWRYSTPSPYGRSGLN